MPAIDTDKLKLSQLRALAAVADARNFSEAAHQLGLTQSAVSHAIASLETALGVILFARGRQGAALTPVGEEVVREARQILDSIAAIGQAAQRSRGLQGGRVRVAAFRSLAIHFLPRAVAHFNRTYPDIAVSVEEFRVQSEVERALRNGVADIGLAHLPPAEGFEGYELFRDEYLAILPASAEVGEPLTWEALGRFPLILSARRDSCTSILRRHFQRCDRLLNIGFEVDEVSTSLGMVGQGLGATILPRLAVEPLPSGLRTYSLPVPLERTNGVIRLATALHPPAVFAFIETLKTL